MPKSASKLVRALQSLRAAAGRPVLACYDVVLFYSALLLLALTSILWSGCAIVLELVLPRQAGRSLGRFMIMFLFRALFSLLHHSGRFRFDFSALDALREEKSLIIAANHPALWDAVMIVSRLPNAVCVMKDALVGNIFLGRGAGLAGYICNESARKVIVQAVAELRLGSHVVLFPEGTRTTVFPVNQFKGGIGIIARQAGATVQTVLIDTNTPFLTKGWAVLRKPPMPIRCTLRLGRRFAPGDSAGKLNADLQDYFCSELAAQVTRAGQTSMCCRAPQRLPADHGRPAADSPDDSLHLPPAPPHDLTLTNVCR